MTCKDGLLPAAREQAPAFHRLTQATDEALRKFYSHLSQ